MFKRLKLFFKTDLAYFLTISLLLLGISISPQIKRQLDTPKDLVFSGLEFYSDDYSIYVSNVFQGMRGRWTLLDKHTTEPHPGTIIHDEYLLWGKFTSFFHVDQITSYHLFRYTMGFILLIMVWMFLGEVSSKNRRLAFFLITFSTGIGSHMPWLTEMDVFYRFVALPHYLLGNIFFLGALINFIKYTRKPITNNFITSNLVFGSLCSLMLALIHPVSLVSLMALFGIYLLFHSIFLYICHPEFISGSKWMLKQVQHDIVYFICSLTISFPIILYYKYLMTIPPWNHMAAWEGVTQYYVPLKEFALAIGPTFFLGLLGLLVLLRKNYSTFLLIFSWILSFFLLIYFSYPYLHISQVRFMQVFIFIPFGVLAAEGIKIVSSRATRRIGGGVAILLILINAVPYYNQSLKSKYNFFTDFSPLVYPDKGTVAGYNWLRDNTNPENAVLAGFLAGTQIPYFSNNTVYVGHLWATLNRETKNQIQDRFLKNEMTVDEAGKFFKDNRIKYFFDGWQEASYGINTAKYPFLKPVFQNPSVTIFKAE